ncbi:putative cyclin 1 putativeserine peptidase family S51 peptidase E [Leptomonas pyrrhocoris]|uniref:Putative cyclin 1 putativeserine peptidase family S51 peptidase E n=1 Tax=Leptomonas pyrrhocoris TaxID=157538 RepID=A0A0N0VE77_LEPPY|nr:putative cyclin 1 putativeserine peptidase family S51 peptidase E [Leptomonas pyrrhocoris]XP_015655996.1 putative cyclin 1 putativeserine peptidase family S51 peptidase E [Leptomonas pyrrhocoris]XP_015655997.1 putative cyclin 1 putativeserine peptidase family S51 peptidase E [Leptomonas pyrrhocoris]KPA77556.1 putative cyclin 1 putativeserine peptidase family S51 peptidase E [Leptomonas pyrrhocoris]KPA77557.1 putative cyclin 1 putativeserine peptidase family S51 peptidase E [Leptomonas pyrrho|eukprot:XP_015655995.1 putative cyclin 1 putativeserine peptidase family S51 peptidase E [Leptomonas pyrrhocoris]
MNSIRACVCGSGYGAFSEAAVIDRLLALVGTPRTGRVCVAYVGTATYDLPDGQAVQTSLLSDRGCDVRPIRVADPAAKVVSDADAAFLQNEADVVVVSGGNTLYAVRRWEETGLDKLLRAAAARQVVLAGGSAGAICWFTSGHSDSADPATYLQPSLTRAALDAGLIPAGEVEKEEANLANLSTSWSYIRVHGLDILPGLVCPHFDVTQGNGVRREEDFTKMLRRHPSERGIGMDHWSVLVLKGDGAYEVMAVPGKTRTASPANASDTATMPGVFTLDVVDGEVRRVRAPTEGKVSELLRAPTGPLVADPFERFYAMENPTPSSGSLLRR